MSRHQLCHPLLRLVTLVMVVLLAASTSLAQAFINGQSADLVLGQLDFMNASPATSQKRLSFPNDVAVDPTSGKVFIADTANHRVLRFASRASLSNGADAEGVLGQPNFSSMQNAASAQGMNLPRGVVVDRGGHLWVADTSNNRVLRFDNAAGKENGAAADGVLGQRDFTSNIGTTTPTGLNSPSGVALDESGRLWVADKSNNRVLRFDNAAGKENGAAADGVLGQPDFTSNASATSAQGMFVPSGVAVGKGGQLWVAEFRNNRVVRFDNAAGKGNGAAADGVLGQPSFTSNTRATSAQALSAPSGIALDVWGQLWVADYDNNRVVRFNGAASKDNGAVADGVLGQPDFTSNLSAAGAQGMFHPVGVAVDGDGALWVADDSNHRVLFFDVSLRSRIYLPSIQRE
jgi:sugar lactone lactonase YvrE